MTTTNTTPAARQRQMIEGKASIDWTDDELQLLDYINQYNTMNLPPGWTLNEKWIIPAQLAIAYIMREEPETVIHGVPYWGKGTAAQVAETLNVYPLIEMLEKIRVDADMSNPTALADTFRTALRRMAGGE